ncbi:hypothetical protein YC2023_066093 [Brassica napus]
MSVAVHQYTYKHAGPWTQHAGPSCELTHRTSVAVRVCPCLSVSTHRTSVAVRDCPSAHTGRPWLSVCVCGCPSPHTGNPWLSISTHISLLVLGLSTLVLPMDCLGDFGPRGLSVQYTQNVRGCPPAHKGRLWLSISTHWTSVAVRVFPSAHTGRMWLSISTYISTLVLGLSTLTLPVDCSCNFGARGLSVQYTQDVRGCPPAHTGRPWLSVCVRGCPPAHTGRPWLSVCVRLCPSAHIGCPWLSISTHISTLLLGICTLALPVDCLGDFGPCRLSCQYIEDVRGCPPAHTGRLWLYVAVRQHTQDVHGCPCVSACRRRRICWGRLVCPSGAVSTATNAASWSLVVFWTSSWRASRAMTELMKSEVMGGAAAGVGVGSSPGALKAASS